MLVHRYVGIEEFPQACLMCLQISFSPWFTQVTSDFTGGRVSVIEVIVSDRTINEDNPSELQHPESPRRLLLHEEAIHQSELCTIGKLGIASNEEKYRYVGLVSSH